MSIATRIIKLADHILEGCFLAVIFFAPLYFSFFQDNFNVFDLNKLVVFRILLLLMILAYIAKIFLTGRISWQVSKLFFILVLLIFLAIFLSTVFSLHPLLSLWGSYERQQGFYSLASYLIWAVLIVLFLKDKAVIRRAVVTIVVSAALASAYGLVQYFYLDPLSWSESALTSGRIFSTLGQPNFFGHYLVLVIPITIYCGIFISQRLVSRFFVSIILLAESWCLLATYSRGAWLAFLASLIISVIFILFLQNKKRTAYLLAVIIFLGLLSLVGLNLLNQDKADKTGNNFFLNRINSIFDLQSGSNKVRLDYWQASVKDIANASWQRLAIGYGPETLDSVFVKYYQTDWGINEQINTYPDRAHNLIFDLFLSYGLIGLLAHVLFFGYLVYSVVKYLFKQRQLSGDDWLAVALLASLISYFVNNLFSFSLTACYIYLYLFSALLWLIINRFEPERGLSLRLSSPSRIMIWLALLPVAVIFIYWQNITVWLADFYYLQAKRAEVRSDCRGVFTNMDKAVYYNPDSVYYKERLIELSINCLSAVQDKSDQQILRDSVIAQANSIDQHEFQYKTWLYIAQAKALFGFYFDPVYYQSAELDFKRLIALSPYITSAYRELGRMKLWQGETGQALTILDQAINILPALDYPGLNPQHRQQIIDEEVVLLETRGLTYQKQQKYEQALADYFAALRLNPRHLPLYKKIADVYYQQNQLDKAINYNQRGLNLNPEDYKWYYALGLLYDEKGDRANALAYATRALELHAGDQQLIDFFNQLKMGN